MRRWLLIFLLLLLPFQLSWAASAAYCEHERDQPGHWGHHEEEPRGTDRTHAGDGARKNATTQPNGAVGHCVVGLCGCALQANLSVADAGAMPQPRQLVQAMLEERFVSHVSEVPVRPARSPAV